MSTPTDNPFDDLLLRVQKAENTGDIDLMASLLADDITVIIPGTPVITGKADGVAFLKSWFEGYTIHITYTPEQTQVDQNLAYQWATYAQQTIDKQTGEKASETGRILWIYTHTSGTWLQQFVIWNTV